MIYYMFTPIFGGYHPWDLFIYHCDDEKMDNNAILLK